MTTAERDGGSGARWRQWSGMAAVERDDCGGDGLGGSCDLDDLVVLSFLDRLHAEPTSLL